MAFYSIEKDGQNFLLLHVHIPKAAGTAVSHFLCDLGFKEHVGADDEEMKEVRKRPPQHFDYEALDYLFDLDKISFGFAIVRNPYRRLLSSYHWQAFKEPALRAEFEFDDVEEQERFKQSKYVDFNDWVEEMFSHYQEQPYFMGNHIRPQHFYVGPKLQTAFKYEIGLETIFTNLFQALGFQFPQPLTIPKKNVSRDYVPEEFKHPVASKKTMRDILGLYGQDFELFGYDPNDHPFS